MSILCASACAHSTHIAALIRLSCARTALPAVHKQHAAGSNSHARMWRCRMKVCLCLQVGSSVSHYKYTISTGGAPLRLHMMGAELALDSHFDEYILDFKNFTALDEDDEAPFELPDSCKEAEAEAGRRPLSLLLATLIPKVRFFACACACLGGTAAACLDCVVRGHLHTPQSTLKFV